jgi:hypothetical protein
MTTYLNCLFAVSYIKEILVRPYRGEPANWDDIGNDRRRTTQGVLNLEGRSTVVNVRVPKR